MSFGAVLRLTGNLKALRALGQTFAFGAESNFPNHDSVMKCIYIYIRVDTSISIYIYLSIKDR